MNNFSDPIQVKNRIIAHAAFQFADISTSKSWKLITFYRSIAAVWKSHLNIWKKMENSLRVVSQYVGINHEDEFDPKKVSPVGSVIEKQKMLFGKTITPKSKIAVILHLYYVDLWPEMNEYLKHIQEPFDLFISIPQGKEALIFQITSDYPSSYIYTCPNCGRDVAPFVEINSAIIDSRYDFICKIHTKKSHHLNDGDQWRQALLGSILGSQERVGEIISQFNQYPDLGMVVPEGYLYSAIDMGSMLNLDIMKSLSELFSISLQNFEFEYPAGSMFWCRGDSFKKLAQSGIQTKDFPPEHGQLNNTLAHGLERFFGLMIFDKHQFIADTSFLKS